MAQPADMCNRELTGKTDKSGILNACRAFFGCLYAGVTALLPGNRMFFNAYE